MKVYATYDPASVLKGGYEFEKRIIEDLGRFTTRQLRSPVAGSPSGNSTVLGFDTEYSATGELLTVGFADANQSRAIETSGKWQAEAKKILKSAQVICGHSVEGDLDYLVKNKLCLEKWLRGKDVYDSFLLARMVDENRGRGGYNLQSLLLSECNFSEWKSETEALLKKTNNAADWTPDQRTERCRLDAWATRILCERFAPQIDKELYSFTASIAMSLHRVGLAGAAINLRLFHKLGRGWKQEAERLRQKITRYAHSKGVSEFVPTKDDHLREILYKKLHYPVLSKTEKGGLPQVNKATLQKIIADCEGNHVFIKYLLEFNKVDKLASTWYGSEMEGRKKSVGELIQNIPGSPNLGLLHFWIYSLRARTGRRASGGGEEGDPESRNSQNWPPAARKVVVSRWKNGKIAICDFTRLEVVLMGWRAGDEKLLDYFLNGSGYIGVAKEFWGQDVKEGTPLYKGTKSLVLGLDYNMGWYKLALDLWNKAGLRLSEDWNEHCAETKRVRKRYLAMFSGLRRYIRDRITEVTDTQQVVSPSGRIRHLSHHGPDSEGFWHIRNAAVNQPIQSFASDVTGGAVIDYEAALLREHNLSYLDWHRALSNTPWDPPCSPVFNEVHDELDLDLHPKSGKRDLEILVDCMENVRSLKKLVPGFDLKLKVDVKVRKDWCGNG